MRRVVIDRYGPPEVMEVVTAPDPVPGDDDVLVRVAAAGVNFADIHQRTGDYTVQHPYTPGIEGSGVIIGTGRAVTGFAMGDRVAWAKCPGAYATHCVVPAELLVPVPDGLSLADAATVLIHGMVAHFLVSDVAPLSQGSTCLVHAAAGGVGGLLCQLARMRGATVIATVSSAAKAQAARQAGAEHVIDYSREKFADRVMELTGGVDVVYDAVGRDTFAADLDCLRRRGTLVLYGQSSGPAGAIDPQDLTMKGSLFLTKALLSHYDTTRELMLRRAAEVFGHVAQGRLRPRVHRAYALQDAALAHQAVETRKAQGKVLIHPAG